MEDGPKLLPQWLRGNSSALHHRGDVSDASKRGKPASSDTARPASQADPWLSRTSSGGTTNGPNITAASKAPTDFGRVPERGSLTERSWKPRDNSAFAGPNTRSSYVPAPLKPIGRDDRDSTSLKPAGSYGSGRAYGRPGESEGGAVAAGGARLDRTPDGWPPARTPSNGSRAEDDARSPLRGGAANAAGAVSSAAPSKASFEKDFPSLRPSPGSSGSPAAPAAMGGGATSAPLISGFSSPLLDTASSGSTSLLMPYRQTFLSSRTSSNWTSKLAEAPSAPYSGQQIPSARSMEDDIAAPPPAAATPSPSPSPPPPPPPPPAAAHVAPAPVAPPRPAGVWGTPAAAAAVAAAAEASNSSAAVGVSATSRARLEQLAVRQSKQLIPVISSSGGKSKAGGVGSGVSGLGVVAGSGTGGGGAAAATSGRLGGAVGTVPKPVVAPAGMLKMSAGKRDDAAAAAGGPAGTLLLANSTVILSKKASLPLDRPLTLTRSTSATGPPPPATAAAAAAAAAAATASATAVAAATVTVTVTAVAAVATASATAAAAAAGFGTFGPSPQTPEGAPAACACGSGGGGNASDAGGRGVVRSAVPESAATAASQAAPADPPAVAQPDPSPPHPPAAEAAEPSEQQQRAGVAHPALQVLEEEEAFLRSLGWTGFDEEDVDEDDTGLTEEEIAAFRAQQQRQAAAAAASSGWCAAAAAAPKPVPGAAARRRGKALIVAASYGSEQISSSTDSDSECE